MVGDAEVGKDTSCTGTEIGFLASRVAGYETSVTMMERLDIEVGDMQMGHLIVLLKLGDPCIVDGE